MKNQGKEMAQGILTIDGSVASQRSISKLTDL